MASQTVLSSDGTDPLPTITCSVDKNSLPAEQLMLSRGSTVLVSTQGSQELEFNMADMQGMSVFGMYACEAVNGQTRTTRTIHIAERGKHWSIS